MSLYKMTRVKTRFIYHSLFRLYDALFFSFFFFPEKNKSLQTVCELEVSVSEAMDLNFFFF